MLAPVSFVSTASYMNAKAMSAPRRSDISFGSARTFDELIKPGCDPKTSILFRDEDFRPYSVVRDAILKVFDYVAQPKMLIIGVGKGQEVFSDLAVMHEMFRQKNQIKPVSSYVDLNCIDFQPKISEADLRSGSRYVSISENRPAKYAPISFNRDLFGQYEIIPEIYDYVKKTFNDPTKTKWKTRVQDFAPTAKPQSYHIISMNNVLMYIDKAEREPILLNVLNLLAPKGILITDPLEKVNLPANFTRIAAGIYKRLK